MWFVFLALLRLGSLRRLISGFSWRQLWTIYLKLPTDASRKAKEQKRLQLEILRVRKDMAGTSSQDEFAKWAKLRRQHDKKVADLEKIGTDSKLQTPPLYLNESC